MKSLQAWFSGKRFKADRMSSMCMLARFGNFIFSCGILQDVLWPFRLASLLFLQPMGYWMSHTQFLLQPHISGGVTFVPGDPSPQIRAYEMSMQRSNTKTKHKEHQKTSIFFVLINLPETNPLNWICTFMLINACTTMYGDFNST